MRRGHLERVNGNTTPSVAGARVRSISPELELFKLHADLMSRASAGELEAQRAMRDLALAGYSNGDLDLMTASFWALIMARLAAAHGHRVDRMALASTLCVHAAFVADWCPERHDDHVGEAFAIIDTLADGTDAIAEHAADYLQQNSLHVRPEVLARATELRGLV